MNSSNNKKIFVVIIMSYFGDALVGNSLFQNIKRIYPDSKTVFIINKQYYEVAKYQKDVDEVVIYDKNAEHKGFFGMLKFIKQFPYKNVECIFKMCHKERVDIISLLLHPKKIVNYDNNSNLPTHERYCNLLKKITKEKITYLPIVYNADDKIPEKFSNILTKNNRYIAICTVSSNIKKDMPLQTAIELINKLNDENYTVLLVGTGEKAKEYALNLENNNCIFINLVNNTTIYELAQILRNCKGLISVDTGTMHLGYAVKTPTTCVLYLKDNIKLWAPDKTLYPHTIIPQTNSASDIYEALKTIL